jgi:virulence-associated protein VapD
LVVNVRNYTDQNLNHVEEMKENQLRLDVSLSQWFDVKNRLSTRPIEPIQTQATKLIQAMERHIHLFEFSLKDMNRISLNRHQKAIDELQSMLNELRTKLDELSVFISDEDVLQANLVYTNITNQVDAVRIRYDMMNKVVIRDLSLLINFAFALILFVLAVLVFGMIRFVYFQIPYIVNSLTDLADKHYHQSQKKQKPFFIEKNIHG